MTRFVEVTARSQREDIRRPRGPHTRLRQVDRRIHPHRTGIWPGYVKLRCPHCKMDIKTFAEFQKHLSSPEHTTSMQQLKQRLQVTLARMRKKQRNQQHELEKVLDEEGKNVDEETGKKLAPIYCKVCKLVFHQKRIEHNASEMHRLINDFLNPRCSVCDTDYFSPMAYERHIATLQHIRRRADSDIDEKDKDLQQVVEEMDDEQLDLNNFMTLDEVGEVEDVDEEVKAEEEEGERSHETSNEDGVKRERDEPLPPPPPTMVKVDPDDPVGDEYIRVVEMFYCDLCHKFLPRCSLDKSEHVRRTHCLSKAHQDAYCAKKQWDVNGGVKDEVKEEPDGGEEAADDADYAAVGEEEEEETQGQYEDEDDDEEEEDDDTYNKRHLNKREDDDVLELDYEGEGSLTGD